MPAKSSLARRPRATSGPITMRQKIALMRKCVALPTAEDWALFGHQPKLVNGLNAILTDCLALLGSGKMRTYGEIGDYVFARIEALRLQHPDVGIGDSETWITVATFFTVHWDTGIYDFLRYDVPCRREMNVRPMPTVQCAACRPATAREFYEAIALAVLLDT